MPTAAGKKAGCITLGVGVIFLIIGIVLMMDAGDSAEDAAETQYWFGGSTSFTFTNDGDDLDWAGSTYDVELYFVPEAGVTNSGGYYSCSEDGFYEECDRVFEDIETSGGSLGNACYLSSYLEGDDEPKHRCKVASLTDVPSSVTITAEVDVWVHDWNQIGDAWEDVGEAVGTGILSILVLVVGIAVSLASLGCFCCGCCQGAKVDGGAPPAAELAVLR